MERELIAEKLKPHSEGEFVQCLVAAVSLLATGKVEHCVPALCRNKNLGYFILIAFCEMLVEQMCLSTHY